MARRTVTGEIHFDLDTPLFRDATIYVRLHNVSQADAPARSVAEQVITGVSHTTREVARQPFELVCESVSERADYTVSVLVDIDGDGVISTGDLITTQSYPVLTFNRPDQVSIKLTEVR